LSLFTLFDATFPTYNRVNLPKVNPFVSYDDKKFKERFRLSKRVVERLLDEVSDNQTTLFYILSSNSFIPPVCPQTKVTQSGDSRQRRVFYFFCYEFLVDSRRFYASNS